MKTNFQHLKQIALAAAVLSLGVACEKEDASSDFGELAINLGEVSEIAMIDRLSDEVDNMAENVYYIDERETLAGKSTDALKSAEDLYFFSDCVIITSVMTETTIEKTLDFGAGCQTANGNILSGMIHLSYARDMEANMNTINASFENFYFNNARVSGERVVVRTRTNENGNPQANITFNIDVVWESGSTIKREGSKIREWIEGVANGDWTDNVYLITGNWTTTFSNGNVHQGEVITPLRRELSCFFLVSGELHLQRNNNSGTLDYGSGSCDSEAVFTYANGDRKTISLD